MPRSTEAKEITETTLQGVRDLSQLLHPSTLDDFGLPDTLRIYLKRLPSGPESVRSSSTPYRDRLPSDVEACVYRIVEGALNNVARYSGASVGTVSLTVDRGFITTVIVPYLTRGFHLEEAGFEGLSALDSMDEDPPSLLRGGKSRPGE